MLQFADRFMKIPHSIVVDVLVQVEKFYFLIEFIVIDTPPIEDSRKHISIILGRPFQRIVDAYIHCRNQNIMLSFGNMIMKLNIFNIAKQPHDWEDEVVDIDVIEKSIDHTLPSNFSNDSLQEWLKHVELIFDEINAFLN